MLIAQISDIHIVEKGELTLGVAPMADNLKKTIAHINALDPKPDCVLVTGDITDLGTPASYQYAAQLLNQLDAPYFLIPGNHDDNQNLWAEFKGKPCPAPYDSFINYVIDEYPIRLIGMDSSIPDAHGGELCPKRLAWLDDELARDQQKPTIIFMHHPPVKCGVIESDVDGFIGAKELGNIIAKYDNIERIVSGHIHLPTHAKWLGTLVSTCPSIGIELNLDLTMNKPSGFVLTDPAFQLHQWAPGNLVTHTVYVRGDEQQYLF